MEGGVFFFEAKHFMPILTVNINIARGQYDAGALLSALTKAVGDAFHKPVQYVAVQVNDGCNMTFGGDASPCALCTVGSIGNIDLKHNTAATVAITKVLKEMLGIGSQRMYITFQEIPGANLGFDGSVPFA